MVKIDILVIEDNIDHLYFIKKALSDKTYVLHVITTGTAAYNYLLNPKVKPDVVVLDNHLPDMTGLEILEKLGSKRKAFNFIFLTVDKSIDTVVEAMNLGATDFLVKTPNLQYDLPQKIDKVYKISKDKIKRLETEANFKSIIESGDDDIWSLDTNYKITAFNTSFKKNVYELTQHKIKIGVDILKIFSKENIAFWKPKYDSVLRGKKESFEFNNPSDKLSRYYDFRLNPIVIDGVVTGLSVMGRDITERKKVEQELSKKNQLLSNHMNNTPLAAIYTDANSIIKEWNIAAENIFGYSEKEALGKNLISLVTPKKRKKKIEAVCNTIFAGKGHSVNSNINLTKEGKLITCNWYNTLITDINNNPIGSASLVEDITKQTDLENTIKSIEYSVTTKIGEDYYNALAKALNKTLKADYIIIAEYNKDNDATTSLSYLNKQKVLPSITYDLAHTPCAIVSKDGYCCYSDNVAQIFNKDIYLTDFKIAGYIGTAIYNEQKQIVGQIIAMFCKPITDESLFKTLMSFFADKVGAEIERNKLIENLAAQKEDLIKSQEIAQLGAFSYNVITNIFTTSKILDTIVGVNASYPKNKQGWVNLCHPADLAKAYAIITNATNKNGLNEFRIIRFNDKKIIWVKVDLKQEFDNNKDKLIKISGTIQDITERKKFENDIKTKNYFLKESQSIAKLVSYSYNFKTKNWEASTSLLEMMGLDARKNGIQDWIALIHPKDKKRIFEILDKRKKGLSIKFNEIYRIIHAITGKIIWVNHIIQDIKKDNSGNLLPTLGIVQDITDRKLAEEALKQSEEKLQEAQEIAQLGSYNLNLKNQTFTSSLIFDSIVGLNPKDTKTFATWRTITHPDDTPENQKALEIAIKTGEVFDREYRILTKDKQKLKWLHGLGKIIYKNGEASHFTGTIQDITDHKKQEDAISQYGKLIEDSLNEIYIFNVITYKFIQVNKGGRINLGYSLKELQSMTVLDIKPHFLRQAFKRLIEPLNKGTKDKIIFRTEHLRKDSSLYPAEISLQKSIYNSEPVYIAFVTDISQRQREEEIKEIIYKISYFAQKTPSLKSLLPFIKKSLNTVINTENFYVALFDEKTQNFTVPYRLDNKEGKNKNTFPKEKSFSGYVLDSKKALLSTDTAIKALIKKGIIKEQGIPSKSWLGVPLISDNKAIGVMAVQNYNNTDAYSQKDVALLQLVATNISQVISQAKDFELIQLLNQALIQSPEAVFVVDLYGNIVFLNPAFIKMSGYSKKELMGSNPRILKSGQQADKVYKKLWQTITSGKTWVGEFVNKRKDGSHYLVAANISAVKNKKGKITHYIAVEEDITEKRQLERDFIHAFVEAQEVEKQAFGEDLHDGISQILAAEAMYIDVLIRQNQDRLEGKAKFLTKIKELNLSAIDEARNIAHGLMAKQLKEQGLIKAIEIICEDYNNSRNIDFSFFNKNLKESDLSKEIKTHLFRVTQEIATNIIRHANASKASIKLSKLEQDNMQLIIKDNGVGIDYDKIKRDKKGAGLKNIERRITLLNGTVKIDSEIDKGTCFTILVPLQDTTQTRTS